MTSGLVTSRYCRGDLVLQAAVGGVAEERRGGGVGDLRGGDDAGGLAGGLSASAPRVSSGLPSTSTLIAPL